MEYMRRFRARKVVRDTAVRVIRGVLMKFLAEVKMSV